MIRLLALALMLVSCESEGMGFPGSREHTYGPAEPVRSPDLNAIQDAIVDLYAGNLPGSIEGTALYYTDPVPVIIPGALAVSAIHTPANTAAIYRYGYIMIADTAPVTYPIPGLRDGDVITAYSVLLDKVSGGAGSYQGWVKSYNAAAVAEADESAGTGIQNFGGASGPGTVLGEVGLAISVTSGKQYYIAADPSASCTNDVLQHAIVWVARPRP